LSIMAGWGGPPGLFNFPGTGPTKPGYGRILTFTVGATATLKAPAFGHKDPPVPALTANASPQVVHDGGVLFGAFCANCHGLKAVAGALPDLRYSNKETLEGIEKIVLGGSRASAGMPSFQKILNAGEVRAIQAYIIWRTQESAKPAANQAK
jgi:mono/diheme cytochrome c family protein